VRTDAAATHPPEADFPEHLSDLDIPRRDPSSLMRHFGPGMMLMMTGIGTSHLVTAPTAGGRFEYALLWCVPVAYVFKYYGFEMAFRFTNATGMSLLDAYSTAWKKWPLWYVMASVLVQCAVGQAGRLAAASAVAYYAGSELLDLPFDLWMYGVGLGIVSVVAILRGRYGFIELVAKALAALLVLSTLTVYFATPAPLSGMYHMVTVEIPEGSWLVIAAFLGLLPTGIDVSLQASEWGKARRTGLSQLRPELESLGFVPRFDPFAPDRRALAIDVSHFPEELKLYCRRWFQIGLWDYRLGHVISAIMAALFLLLAAVWLYPSPVEGTAVMGEIARIFTLSLGPAFVWVFLAGAFAATFSTAFNYFDGWPRIVAACCRNLFPGTGRLSGIDAENVDEEHRTTWYSEYNVYRMTMLYSLVASVAIIVGLPRPVFLVLVASALSFFIAPVIYFLNVWYCVTTIPKDDEVFYPSGFARGAAWISLGVFAAMTSILISARIFGLAWFGA
jgi:Mn2+/Fe2+ NRAMP family transporter